MPNHEHTPELENAKATSVNPDLLAIAESFAKENEEFKAVDLQRHLKCGFGTVTGVLDALCDSHIIEAQDTSPRKYKSLVK
jgi:hypothetical protein